MTPQDDYYTNERYASMSITVDAQTGTLHSYYFYDSAAVQEVRTYDIKAAEKLADEIAEAFAGDIMEEFGECESDVNCYTDRNTGLEEYYGSHHRWQRYAYDIPVQNQYISVEFDADMKLSMYDRNYIKAELPSPENMLTPKQVMDKFWEKNDIDLHYLARLNDRKTKTVLVYSTGRTVYCDAFTGEPVYNYAYSSVNDLSGITDKKLLKKAKVLDEHGLVISADKFSQKDAVTAQNMKTLLASVAGGYYYSENTPDTTPLTRGAALKLFTSVTCGDEVAQLKGIYKSPFSDISDDDENIGYYAIAYALGAVDGGKLEPDKKYTYADLITLVYDLLSQA